MNRSLVVLALTLAVMPTLVVNLLYLVAASEGYVPWCVPYWESCTSISATGRHGTAFYLFKLTMLPLALLYWIYWRQANHRLNTLGYGGRSIRYVGGFAAVALAVYTLALGAVGDNFQLIRRIGIIFYFTLTYLCQLLIFRGLNKVRTFDPSLPWQQGLLLLILVIGILTVVLDATLSNYEDYEYAFEWVVALLLHLNFLLAALSWHRLRPQTGSH